MEGTKNINFGETKSIPDSDKYWGKFIFDNVEEPTNIKTIKTMADNLGLVPIVQEQAKPTPFIGQKFANIITGNNDQTTFGKIIPIEDNNKYNHFTGPLISTNPIYTPSIDAKIWSDHVGKVVDNIRRTQHQYNSFVLPHLSHNKDTALVVFDLNAPMIYVKDAAGFSHYIPIGKLGKSQIGPTTYIEGSYGSLRVFKDNLSNKNGIALGAYGLNGAHTPAGVPFILGNPTGNFGIEPNV